MAYLLPWVALSVLVALFAYGRGHNMLAVFGFLLLGLLFSPLVALIAAALIPPSDQSLIDKGRAKQCPHCLELVRPAANVCSHCG